MGIADEKDWITVTFEHILGYGLNMRLVETFRHLNLPVAYTTSKKSNTEVKSILVQVSSMSELNLIKRKAQQLHKVLAISKTDALGLSFDYTITLGTLDD